MKADLAANYLPTMAEKGKRLIKANLFDKNRELIGYTWVSGTPLDIRMPIETQWDFRPPGARVELKDLISDRLQYIIYILNPGCLDLPENKDELRILQYIEHYRND
jgi:hypothetical protein